MGIAGHKSLTSNIKGTFLILDKKIPGIATVKGVLDARTNP